MNLGVELVTGDNATQVNIKKLSNRRVTAVLDDPLPIGYNAKVMALDGRFVNAGTIDALDIYIAFSPKIAQSSKYADILTKGMKWLRETGRLQGILDRYGVVDWKK